MTPSVIIPTYNRAHCLPRALDSVFTQSCEVDEVIVVDDGSTDSTAELISQRYPQVKYIHQQQAGVSAARNKGLQIANSEWIALLDSDDEWLPHKLEQQFQQIKENPQLLVCHTEETWIRNGVRVNQMRKHQKRGGWIYQYCLPLCAMSPSSVLIHRSVFEEVGLFKEHLPACEDYDLWLRVCSRFPVAYVAQASIKKYGGHKDQLSSAYWGMDRFRIQALWDILKENVLQASDKTATLNMLRRKISIFNKGARKRGNDSMIEFYENLLLEAESL